MRGLTEEERETLTKPEGGLPCRCCGIPGGGEVDSDYEDHEIQVNFRLVERGLMVVVACEEVWHFRNTVLAKLALECDLASRQHCG